MSVALKFTPLSFINSSEEILKQIKNTVVFSYLFNQFEETTLDHYVESTQYGYTASANDTGTHRLLRITDINSGKVNWETVPFCDCDSEKKYLLKDNDILIARTGGTTGKSFIVLDVPANAIFASYLIRLRLKEKVNIDFINCFLNSYAFWSQIIEMKAGSAMPNVNAEKLKTLRLPKCNIETQNKVLSAIKEENRQSDFSPLFQKMASIESAHNKGNSITTELTHQLTLVQKLRQQLLQEAVQGKLVPQDPSDEPASILLQKIKTEKERLVKEKKIKKDKDLPEIKAEEIPFEIPEGWVWCRLGEIANAITYGTSEKAFEEGEVPVLRMGNITTAGKILYSNLKFVSSKIDDLPRLYLENGDMVFNRTNSYELVGKTAVFENDLPYTLASYLIRVRFLDLQNPKFISIYFNSSSCRLTQIEPQIIQQNGQANFNGTKLGNVIIPLPPLAEQHRIVQKLEQLLQVCDDLQASIQESRGYNEQLLQQVLREALKGE